MDGSGFTAGVDVVVVVVVVAVLLSFMMTVM
jgi:hypothetical protein